MEHLFSIMNFAPVINYKRPYERTERKGTSPYKENFGIC